MKRLIVVLFPAVLVLGGVLFFVFASTPEAAKDYKVAYAPEQPINFSHKIHATDMEIPCQFCHSYARRSKSSGVPPVAACYNCHKIIGGTSEQGKKDIAKVREAYLNDQPIEWVKVHDIQDFVYYTHKAHIQIGEDLAKVGDQGFTCQNCHGPVQNMGVAELRAWDPELDEKPLSMGWCLTCHIEKSEDAAKVLKLKRVAQGRDVAWESLIDEVDITAHDVEMTKYRLRDCWTCHH